MNQGSQVKDVVSQHYSARPNLNREQRNESQIIHLRSFNNWVKGNRRHIFILNFSKRENNLLCTLLHDLRLLGNFTL